MRCGEKLHRGSPVYVQKGQSTIALVVEIAEQPSRRSIRMGSLWRDLVPKTVFVIDEYGVSRLKIADRGRATATALGASALLALLQYYLLSRRWKKDGRVDPRK